MPQITEVVFKDDVLISSNPISLVLTRITQLGQALIFYTPAKDILTRASGFMDAYDFTLKPYSGCSFGCTYCYAAFFSRKADERDSWGKWVKIKSNAVELLSDKLKNKPGFIDDKVIYMSSVTDPYQPIERKIELTRGLLKIMAGLSSHEADGQLFLIQDGPQHKTDPKPKLVVQTRSPDVVRDCDLFQQIEENGGRVRVNMTVTTDDEDVRRTFEPYCPSNSARLRAITQVQTKGIDTCITMTPLLLVKEADNFAEQLLDTGVKRFIIQPFHFQKGKFVAATRDQAFDLMAEKHDTDRAQFGKAYLEHYRTVKDVLQDRLPNLGEGKGGFAPPF